MALNVSEIRGQAGNYMRLKDLFLMNICGGVGVSHKIKAIFSGAQSRSIRKAFAQLQYGDGHAHLFPRSNSIYPNGLIQRNQKG